MPCLVFYNILSSIDSSDLASLGVMLLSAALFQAIGLGFGYLCKYTTGCPKYWKGGLLASGVYANINDFPIAYITTLSGTIYFQPVDITKGTSYTLIFVAWIIFSIFNCSGYRLIARDMHEKDRDMKSNVYEDSGVVVVPIQQLWRRVRRARRHGPLNPVQETPNTELHSATGSSSDVNRKEHLQIIQQTNEVSNDEPSLDGEASPANLSILAKLHRYLARKNLNFVWELFSNFNRPAIITLFISLLLTMFPESRSVFYKPPSGSTHVPNAPDDEPILSFMMDLCKFVGSCCVPLGLLILGATLSRLTFTSMPKGYWKTIVLMTILKLVALPIIAMAWARKMQDLGWISKDNYMAVFVLVIASSAPAATLQVYMTSIYKPAGFTDNEAMSCIAIQIVVQYCVLIFTMPIVLTYTIKKIIGF